MTVSGKPDTSPTCPGGPGGPCNPRSPYTHKHMHIKNPTVSKPDVYIVSQCAYLRSFGSLKVQSHVSLQGKKTH